MRCHRLVLLIVAVVLPAWAQAPYAQRMNVPQLTALGRAIFFDAELSPSGAVSCASCHDPQHAYGPPDADAVKLGFRAAPSLRYLNSLPPFTEHHFDNDGDDSTDMGPTGGHTWDGRAASAHEQARLPLLSPDEMGGPDVAAVVERMRHAGYATQFREAFGADIFERRDAAFEAALMALEVFQQSPADFYPFSSRFDAMLRGQAALSEQEMRGLVLFNDADKGNCASCHLSEIKDGAFPLFTDFGHIAIGVPRNPAIKANTDPRFFDLGMCGPRREDLRRETQYCGYFKTPTLRNVARRRFFFHNGRYTTLREVMRFYVERDTDPERWYPTIAGKLRKFDDLPARYRGNVNTSDAPLNRSPGDEPALNADEIEKVVAFLGSLSDAN